MYKIWIIKGLLQLGFFSVVYRLYIFVIGYQNDIIRFVDYFILYIVFVILWIGFMYLEY